MNDHVTGVSRHHDTGTDSPVASVLALLGQPARDALESLLRPRRFRRGQTVYTVGDRADCLHLVRTGHLDVQVSAPSGRFVVARIVHPGEIVGELALVHTDHRRTDRVCAIETSETLVLSRGDFERIRQEHATVDRLLVSLLAERVVRGDTLLVEMLMPAETRVWRRLGELASAYDDGIVRMSQDELAHVAATVRQTVNRVLQAGVRRGVLAVGRESVRVLDRAAVERLAGRAP